ncbi:MAG: hypothetical protein IKI19_02015 [Prevotella sp.]|nr:hypothetical protein [Prevotella sp.]
MPYQRPITPIRASFLNCIEDSLGNSITIERESTLQVHLKVPTDFLLLMILGLLFRRTCEGASFDQIAVEVGSHTHHVDIYVMREQTNNRMKVKFKTA